MIFITLHSQGGGKPIYLNTATIVSFSEDIEPYSKKPRGSAIGRIGQQFSMQVTETPEQILALLLQAHGEGFYAP